MVLLISDAVLLLVQFSHMSASHALQGNFQNYGESDYAADFALAKEAGIDAFAMNVGHDPSDPAQLMKAFSAAKSSSFKLFFSFDMNYFSKPGSSDVMLTDYLGKYGGHHAHFLYNGRVFVSTFSGEVPGPPPSADLVPRKV
ncbi:glucan endo-1,3-alpha-glucosidase, glycoside hydrolase family 71 protein [Rhodotorula toruloides]|uniref:Glucan endo-1,3-alpha-glucosidase, glycoside hydrolase family 71 protein n=1 Tax=Rhodotorula toruloides TaxID=5286 RepID=A0A511KIA6_RHOTO|nr:glucan endo-1,3-alpha-glucosidase, glycoside hydrolase family 71 protein [Rhodotorula toruloides]